MSDSNDEGVLDSVKKTLIDRINTPLFGFVFLSWITFNWSSILLVMFSKSPIEDTISIIKSGSAFYSKEIICPALVGFVLSVAFPYLQLLVSFLQGYARKLIIKNKESAASEMYVAESNLADVRAKAEGAMDLARAKQELELSKTKNDKATLDYATEKLKDKFDALSDDISIKTEEFSKLNDKVIELKFSEEELSGKVDSLQKKESELTMHLGDVESIKSHVLNFGTNLGYSVQRMDSALLNFHNRSNIGALDMNLNASLIEEIKNFSLEVSENLRYIENEIEEIKGYIGRS